MSAHMSAHNPCPYPSDFRQFIHPVLIVQIFQYFYLIKFNQKWLGQFQQKAKIQILMQVWGAVSGVATQQNEIEKRHKINVHLKQQQFNKHYYKISMNSILLEQRSFSTQNKNKNESQNIFTQRVINFIKTQNAKEIFTSSKILNFQYFPCLDQFQSNKVILQYEQKRKLYKLTFLTKIPSIIINKCRVIAQQLIVNMNKDSNNQLTLYFLDQTNCLNARAIVEKQDLVCQGINQKQFIDNFLRNITLNISEFLKKIMKMFSDQINNNKGKNLNNQLLKLTKKIIDQQINKKCNFPLPKQYKIENLFTPNPRINYGTQPICSEQQINIYNSLLRRLKIDKTNKQSKTKSSPLASKITIFSKQIDKNWKPLHISSFSILQKLKVQYLILGSFNQVTADIIKKSQTIESQKIDNGYFVRKKFKKKDDCVKCKNQICKDCQCGAALKAYQNQIQVITYIGKTVNDSIANYFLQGCPGIPDKVQNLYSKFYPKSLKMQKTNSQQFFKLALEIIKGLKSLINMHIIHRDLKPSNIMLDLKKIPKIIDFGSACPIYRAIQKQKINQQFMTTLKYNLFYSQAVFHGKFQITPDQFERHQLYDIHAFGIIFQQLYTNSQISSQLGSLMFDLSWLVIKCTVHNPNLRLNHDQITLYCSLLLRIYSQKMLRYINS